MTWLVSKNILKWKTRDWLVILLRDFGTKSCLIQKYQAINEFTVGMVKMYLKNNILWHKVNQSVMYHYLAKYEQIQII